MRGAFADVVFQGIRPILGRMDPETAHEWVLAFGRHLNWILPRHDLAESDGVQLGQLRWAGPVGLAAGADKDAVALPLWERLGFGSIEVGTVLLRPQAGNARPRIHRLSGDRAFVNSMGFPSLGADEVLKNFIAWKDANQWPGVPVGLNVSKNRETPEEHAHEDCAAVVRKLRAHVGWVTVNVSSPNTPGLRALQRSDLLRRVVSAVLDEAGGVPVWIKLSPDLTADRLEEAVEAATGEGISGFIVSNTTTMRPADRPGSICDGPPPKPGDPDAGLRLPADRSYMSSLRAPEPGDLPGGLSGDPLWPLARRASQVVLGSTSLPVVGVGGITTASRALAMIADGCSAVQLYTGLVLEGPRLVEEINRAVASRPGRA